jgi:vancomycin permeability regulator SanA
VSDSFHLARAVILAKRAGFKNVYWASPDQGYYSVDDKRYYYFREFLAMIWYLPKFLFG